MVVSMMSYIVVKLKDYTNQTFLVNGQHVNHYYCEDSSRDKEVMDLANDKL